MDGPFDVNALEVSIRSAHRGVGKVPLHTVHLDQNVQNVRELTPIIRSERR